STASLQLFQFRLVPGRDSAEVVTPFVQVGTYPTRNFARIHLAPFPEEPDFTFSVSKRAPRFIFDAMLRIRSIPSGVKCAPCFISRTTSLNLRKSTAFFDRSKCCSKKGTIFPA